MTSDLTMRLAIEGRLCGNMFRYLEDNDAWLMVCQVRHVQTEYLSAWLF